MRNPNPDEESNRFIYSESKWIRVVAGPGAGKSYCLKERLKHLVKTRVVKPEKILVLTFTSVAVQDLKKDIRDLGLGDIEVSTLHTLALRILAKEQKGLRLLLDFERDTMLRDLEPEIGATRAKKAMLKARMSNKDYVAETEEEKRFEASLNIWLAEHRGMILDDQIALACRTLQENREIWRYEYVMVDEYQDLNPDEQAFVELLTAENGSLAVIGDDDQAIYEFKGAAPQGIRDFARKHPGCEDIHFTVCRRCPPLVVECANKLIANNHNREDKVFTPIFALPKGEEKDDTFRLMMSETPEEEIDRLCQMIKDRSDITPLGEVVVLTPVKSRGQKLFDALQKKKVQAELCFRGAVFKDAVIRESVSLLRLLADPNDRISWRYLLGEEHDKRRALSYCRLRAYAQERNLDILTVLENCDAGEIKIPYTYALIKRYREITALLEEIRKDPDKILERLHDQNTQYAKILKEAKNREYSREGFAGVYRAVQIAAFSPESAVKSEGVRIMSLHAAKGLSAGMVIIMSAVEELLPRVKGSSIEEQRRLFYVGITRCKRKEGQYPGKVLISAFKKSEDGEKDYTLSRFVGELGL